MAKTKINSNIVKNKIIHEEEECRNCQEEGKLAQLYLDVAGVMLVALDDKGVVTLVNKKGCEVLGYPEKDILGKNWFDNFLPKEIIPGTKEVFGQLIKGNIEAAEYHENPILRKDGQERLIAFHNTVIQDGKGKIAGILFSGDDITERKKIEEELANVRDDYRELFERINVGIYRSDPGIDGKFIRANEEMARILGYESVDDLLKIKVSEIFQDPEKRPDFVGLVKDEGMVSQNELALRKKDGTPIWAMLSVSAHRDKSGKVVWFDGVFQDVTDRKKRESEIMRRKEELEKINNIMVGRELKMVELKRRVAELERQLGGKKQS